LSGGATSVTFRRRFVLYLRAGIAFGSWLTTLDLSSPLDAIGSELTALGFERQHEGMYRFVWKRVVFGSDRALGLCDRLSLGVVCG
jgi:hypothetical protein